MSKAKPTQPSIQPTEADLPEGWASAILGDVAEVIGGGTPKSTDPSNFADDGHPWITPADLSDFDGVWIKRGRRGLTDQGLAECSARIVPPGTVLMSSRAPIGYVAIAANELCTNQGFKSFVLAKGLDPQFVFYWLKFNRASIEQMGSGSTFMEVSGARCREIPIAFPPLAEQQRIVAKVEALLERVNGVRARLAKLSAILKRFRQSVLAAACSGQLTAYWREEHPKADHAHRIVAALEQAHKAAGGHKRGNAAAPTEEAHDLDPETLPGTWALTDLLTAVCPDRPITYGILKPGPDTPDGIPYVRVVDFPGDSLNIASIRRTTKDIERQYARARLRPGDILLSIRGTVGRVCIVPPELENANITQDTARLSIQDALERDYVAWFLRAKPTQDRMRKAMKGVAVHGINIGDVRAIQLPVPPLDEQREIARRIEALFALVDRIEAHVRAATVRAERLFQTILGRAFRGELVPTEAELAAREGREYEAAEHLLERIRKESDQLKLQKKTGFRATTRKKTAMKKMDKAIVLEIIQAMPHESFAFDELRAIVPCDYDALKDILFGLLDDPESGIVQVFDRQAKAMRFRRRAKL